MRPVKLQDVIGQNKIKMALRILVMAAKKRKDVLGHVLLAGGSGLGKTTIGSVIASEMDLPMISVNGAGLEKADDLAAMFYDMAVKKRSFVLFIDEIHRVTAKVAEWLYTPMEDWFMRVRGDQKIDLPRFTIIGATTHMGRLPKPFADRFKNVFTFEDYTHEDMCKIAYMNIEYHKNDGNDINLSNNIIDRIVETARDTPRVLVKRIEFIRDYLISINSNGSDISIDSLYEALMLMGIDKDGLTSDDRKYMSILESGRAVSLSQLAIKMNADQSTITNEIEPFLIKRNLMEVTPKGRVKKLSQLYYDIHENPEGYTL